MLGKFYKDRAGEIQLQYLDKLGSVDLSFIATEPRMFELCQPKALSRLYGVVSTKKSTRTETLNAFLNETADQIVSFLKMVEETPRIRFYMVDLRKYQEHVRK